KGDVRPIALDRVGATVFRDEQVIAVKRDLHKLCGDGRLPLRLALLVVAAVGVLTVWPPELMAWGVAVVGVWHDAAGSPVDDVRAEQVGMVVHSASSVGSSSICASASSSASIAACSIAALRARATA